MSRLGEYLIARLAEEAEIAADRREALERVAEAVVSELRARGSVDLLFVCTHNSRRSHLGQVWAQLAAEHFRVRGMRTWSGGTEVTEFDRRAAAALERAGLVVESEQGGNPVRLVRSDPAAEPMRCWSKHFQDPANPRDGVVAVMMCSSADRACPSVPGARHRLVVAYDDPKKFDGTERETAAYDDRCRQIAREMLSVFRIVARIAPAVC